MVYGVLKLINFAHGDVFMLGAMMGWYASAKWGGEARVPSIVGVVWVPIVSMAICGVVGFLIERLAYRPLGGAPRLNSLITAIGMSFLLEYGGQNLFRAPPRFFYVLPPTAPLPIGAPAPRFVHAGPALLALPPLYPFAIFIFL